MDCIDFIFKIEMMDELIIMQKVSYHFKETNEVKKPNIEFEILM
jgi:hypothetical protein